MVVLHWEKEPRFRSQAMQLQKKARASERERELRFEKAKKVGGAGAPTVSR